MIDCMCEHCHKVFQTYPSRISIAKFCSKFCHSAAKKKERTFVCGYCGETSKEPYRRPQKFCNHKCHGLSRKKECNLHHRMSRLVRQSLKRGKFISITKSLPYSIEQLRRHLEKQFTPEMNWANAGSYWHIDHKIPISAFNISSEHDIDFQRCWALDNLQPLEARENMKKRDKLSKPFQPALNFWMEKNGRTFTEAIHSLQ